jgi:hypothetical protein
MKKKPNPELDSKAPTKGKNEFQKIMESKAHSCFSMGKNSLAVPFSMHHENRQKIIQRMKDLKVPEHSVILLQGKFSLI